MIKVRCAKCLGRVAVTLYTASHKSQYCGKCKKFQPIVWYEGTENAKVWDSNK